jgi:hypothetical protein
MRHPNQPPTPPRAPRAVTEFLAASRPDPLEKEKKDNAARQRKARIALERQAEKLNPVLAFIRDELQAHGKEPDTEVTITTKEPISKPKKIGKFVVSKGNPKMVDAEVTDAGKGWVISYDTTKSMQKGIVLMEDGSLVLGRNYGNGRFEIGDDPEVSTVDLAKYPFNPAFTQQKGYAITYGKIPQVTTENLASYHSEEAWVGSNVEKIADDLRIYGQQILTLLNPPTP